MWRLKLFERIPAACFLLLNSLNFITTVVSIGSCLFCFCVNCCSVSGGNKKTGKNARNTEYSWSFIWVIILCLGAVGVGGYAVYKYRIRVCFLTLKILHAYAYVNAVRCTMSCVLLSLFKTSVVLSCSLNLLSTMW